MKIVKFALGGGAAVALTFAMSPAFAFTYHPATPAEIQQTDQLNAQALQRAQEGTSSASMSTGENGSAMTGASMNAGGTNASGSVDTSTTTDKNGVKTKTKTDVKAATPPTKPDNSGDNAQ